MVACQKRYAAKLIKLTSIGLLALGFLGLGGCASMIAAAIPPQIIKPEDEIACDKHQSDAKQITEEICEQVNELIHKEAGLPNAVVGFDVQDKGRLQLAGKYKNDDEVEKAFAVAQSVVGSDGVSPVKPGYIQVEGWQKCLAEKFAGRECGDAETRGFEISKKPPGPMREKYALVVGVGQFKSHGINPLNFATKDAMAVADYLADPRLGGFPRNHVTVLTNQQATRQGILNALGELEQRTKPDDLVVVYFSSHGAPPDYFDRVNILTYDTELLFSDRNRSDLGTRDTILQKEAVWKTSISPQRLYEFSRKAQSKRLLIILDACYSGDMFSQIPGFRPTGSEILAKNEENFSTGYSHEELANILGGAKGLRIEGEQRQSPVADATRPFSKGLQRGRSSRSYGNSGKSWGHVIISASNKTEESYEPTLGGSDPIPNSYFTYYFLENLRKTSGRIQDSFNAAVPLVSDTVIRYKRGKNGRVVTQQPQWFAVPNLNEWNFSLNLKR